MWRILTATSFPLAAVRRQANKAMDPTGFTSTPGRAASCARRVIVKPLALDER